MDNEIDSDAKAELRLIKETAIKLSPKFDTIQIIATRHISEDEGTRVIRFGTGNIYARVQSCREYVAWQDEIDKQSIRSEE